MKSKILEIITTKPKHYSRMIKNDNELYGWIMNNTLLDDDRPFVEHIRSALYDETNICENNNIKKFKDIYDGFMFCGRAKVCECCRKSVSENVIKSAENKTSEEILAINEKRKNTNIKKYGVDNIGKIDKAIENHKKFYDDKEMVNATLKQIKKTNLERYGVENPQQNETIRKKTTQTNIERYGVDNPLKSPEIQEKVKETNLERYGVENPSLSPEIREKIKSILISNEIREKTIQTNLDRYGVEYPSSTPEFREKVKETNLERYGVENPSMHNDIRKKISDSLLSSEVQEKIKQTNIERYGVENPTMLEEFQEKIKQTNLEKYGVEYPSMSPKIQEKIKQTNIEKYGFGNPSQRHLSHNAIDIINDADKFAEFIKDHTAYEISKELGIHKNYFYILTNKYDVKNLYQKRGPSYLEIEMAEFLDELCISYETNDRNILNGKELDFYIPSKNIAIEMNGVYWHSDSKNSDKNYHYTKWKSCFDKNIHLVSIFEDDWITQTDKVKSMIKTHLGLKPKGIPARKSTISKIDAKLAKPFLEKYHLQGFVGGTHYGAFDGTSLISVMTFGNTRNQRFELSRFVMDNYNHPGIFSKMFKYAQKDLSFDEVVSFSDNTYFTGNVYDKNGFDIIQVIDPDYKYLYKGKRIHKSNFRKSSIKKKFPEISTLIDEGITETQAMELLGIPKVYDCGKCEWVWKKK